MNLQTQLWLGITDPERLTESSLYARSRTPRLEQAEQTYDRLCGEFAATLSEKQRAAFRGLEGMAMSIQSEMRERGIAIGLVIARDLAALLNDPVEALHQASATYLPFASAEKCAIDSVYAYLYSIKHEK